MPHVAELLPHQPPMRLIDEIVGSDNERIWARASVTPDTPFASEQGLHACFGLELMAQTAAAFFTLMADDESGPRQGMLIASRSYTTSLAYYPQPCQLLISAQLDSPLPQDAGASALVKFSGAIAILDEPMVITTELNDLNRLINMHAVTEASLSVYL